MALKYQLYGSKGSGSAAIEMALRRCHLEYQVIRASTWEEDSARLELAQVNPLGQIPVLVQSDSGVAPALQNVMSESAAILIHLGLTHENSHLLSHAPFERGQSIRGLVYIAANCYSAIGISDYPERWTTSVDKDEQEQVRQAARARLYRSWEVFADVFYHQDKIFLSGDFPGALDFLALVVSKWSGARQHLQEHRPNFYALLLRLEQHPDIAPVFGEHWTV